MIMTSINAVYISSLYQTSMSKISSRHQRTLFIYQDLGNKLYVKLFNHYMNKPDIIITLINYAQVLKSHQLTF